MTNSIRWVVLLFVVGVLSACRVDAAAGMKVLQSGDNYSVAVGTISDSHSKLKGKLIIEIDVLGEWKHNDKAPILVDIQVPEKVNLTNKNLRKKDLNLLQPKKYRFEDPYELSSKGSFDLKLLFDFVLCTETVCQKKRFEVSYSLLGG